ncbi:TRAP transporter small permease [uncultured Halomonas sp.]|uniref:TRAP transporter small permease n=1 Tax=uncultured Halomonas sp. TaxID=173971 RepID=UPI002638BD01|nr:TRAP transporter small permease [uncultured Halomonas sp.]
MSTKDKSLGSEGGRQENSRPEVIAVPDFPVGPIYSAFLRLEAAYAWLLKSTLAIFSILLGGLMFAQVLMRYLFNSPFLGIEEIALLLGAWVYFPAFAYATRQGEHIRGGILGLVVKSPIRTQMINFGISILSIGVCAVFGYFAIKYAMFDFERGRLSSYMRWPRWLWSASLVVGFSGALLALVMQSINQFLDLRRLQYQQHQH